MNCGIVTRIQKPRLLPLLKVLGLLVLMMAAASLAAGTQAEANQSKTAQAVLHIQARVIPVEQLPLHDHPIAGFHGPIFYNIPTSSSQMQVRKEIRPLPSDQVKILGAQDAWLETTTVVPQ
ncbi:MAG TPA: hypothetical protein VEG68_08900 [Terriglobales bacterium]|nr:hypothetical protein [Terriglobales bacterium]